MLTIDSGHRKRRANLKIAHLRNMLKDWFNLNSTLNNEDKIFQRF